MGLLDVLNLPLPASAGALPPPPVAGATPVGGATGPAAHAESGTAPGGPAADPLDATLGQRIDAITALLDGIHDDAAARPLRERLAKLAEGRALAAAQAAGKGRTAAYQQLIASARKLQPEAEVALRKAQAIEKREAARKELDVTLEQVTALVLGGINDDGLRNAVHAELTKQKAARDKAEAIADHAAAEKALRARLPAAQALRSRAEGAKVVTDWLIATWKPQRAKSGAAVAGLAAGLARTLLDARLAALDGDAKARTAAADQPGLAALHAPLQKVETTATAVATATTAVDRQIADVTTKVAALGGEAPQALVDALAALRTRRQNDFGAGADEDAVLASVAAVAGEAGALVARADLAQKQATAKKKVQTELAALKPALDAAVDIATNHREVLVVAVFSAFWAASSAVDAPVAAGDWITALAKLPVLRTRVAEVRKAAADEKAYRAALAPLQADLLRVRSALASPGLPHEASAAFEPAAKTHAGAVNKRDWVAAKAALKALAEALATALEALDDGSKFYEEFAPVQAMFDKATTLLETTSDYLADTTVAGLLGSYRVTRKALTDKIAGGDWRPARRMLPDVATAARALVQAMQRLQAARAPYDAAKSAITPKDAQASAAAARPAPAMAAALKSWQAGRAAVFAAERDGDLARATALLPNWESACDAMIAAQAAEQQADGELGIVLGAIPGLAEARLLAQAPPPGLEEQAKGFASADAAVAKARAARNWPAATAAVPALEAATTALVEAKGQFNADAKPADLLAFADKLKALEPRTARAADAAPGPHLAGLQKTVTDRLAQIAAAQAAPDLAAAEAGCGQLLADLEAMEKGRRAHDALQARLATARSGPVAKARALALKPAALAAERDAALTAAEAGIQKLAGDGKFPAAEAAIDRWVRQAQGWAESQAAHAEIHGGKVPDVATLEALAKKPGGDEVLDAMILNLPSSTPAKVLSAALKARYGFEVKRFAAKRSDVRDTKGLDAKPGDQSDPELVEMYRLLSQIPSQRIRGKISEVIAFDTDDDAGVYYRHDKSIYLHAGKLNDAGEGKQDFGGSDIVAEGEEVLDACKPDPAAQPVPNSNATLLHEAAHAEDAGAGFMKTNKAKPKFGGWKDESPQSIAPLAASHLKFDTDYILEMLQDPASKPPERPPKPPKGVAEADWTKRRLEAERWCRAIRASARPWWKPAVCKEVSIAGRVYFESYDDGRWASYDYAARAQGISGYQFRAAPEWFAELYAAHFAGVLKSGHPAMEWLRDFKPPQG